MPRNIVLVGISGSGKSTIGRALAARLGRPFVDTDELIVSRFGMPIGDVFTALGEVVFRRAESEAVESACGEHGQVVSLGGGAIVNDENFTVACQENVVIGLTVSADVAVRRLLLTPGAEERPMLRGGDPIVRIATMLAARADRYAEAHASVATDGRTVEEIVSEVVAVAQAHGLG